MSENVNNQNVVPNVPAEKTSGLLSKEKRGAFVAIFISGAIISLFVVHYLILGQESRKINTLQLIIAVSNTHIQKFI